MNETETNTVETAENAAAETKAEPTFDDILNENKGYQSEFDKRMTKGINTAIEKERAKWESEQAARAAEAEKLAKMKADEKAQYEREKAEKALADREAAVTKRELAAEAKSQLSDMGLPVKLAEVLDYSSAEACKASIDAVSAAFNEAVQAAVDERLRPKANPKAGTINTKSAFDAMSVTEKMQYANEHPNDPEVIAYTGGGKK